MMKENQTISKTNFLLNIELSSGSRQAKGLRIRLVETAAAATPSSVFESSAKMFLFFVFFSDEGYSVISCK